MQAGNSLVARLLDVLQVEVDDDRLELDDRLLAACRGAVSQLADAIVDATSRLSVLARDKRLRAGVADVVVGIEQFARGAPHPGIWQGANIAERRHLFDPGGAGSLRVSCRSIAFGIAILAW